MRVISPDSEEVGSTPVTEEAQQEPEPRLEEARRADPAPKDKKLPFSKVVIRRLPPQLTEAQLLEQLSPLPDYDYFYFVSADLSLEPHAFSRAYFNIPSWTDICIFKDKFDGYVFVDPKGHEYPAMVEFAPYQKIPKGKTHKRKDAKMGTIGEDPDYIEFMRVLEEREKGYHFTLDQHLDAIEAKEKERDKKSTPLLEFLKEKRAEKYRIREEKREAKKKKKEGEKKSKDQEKKAKRKEKRDKKFADSKDPKEGSGGSNGNAAKEKKILQREKRPNTNEAIDNIEVKTKVFTNTTNKKEFGKGGKGAKNEKNKQKGLAREGTPKEFRPFNSDQGEKSGERRKFSERPMHKEKRERNRPLREPQLQQQQQQQPPPKVLKRPDRDFNDNPGATGTTEDRTKPEARPKRYSDRRKEERLKRELAKNPTNPVVEEEAAATAKDDIVRPGPSHSRSAKFEDDYSPPMKVKEPPTEEELRRKAEIQAKREQERLVRKERLKNKERPEMQIYRPGMGKFSSKTIKEGKASPPKFGEEPPEGDSPGPKRGGGGGRGYGRGRGRSGRGKIKPFGGGAEPTASGEGSGGGGGTPSNEQF